MLDLTSPQSWLGKTVASDGKVWRVASIHGFEGHRWAWLVNVENKNDQCRLSLKTEAFWHKEG